MVYWPGVILRLPGFFDESYFFNRGGRKEGAENRGEIE